MSFANEEKAYVGAPKYYNFSGGACRRRKRYKFTRFHRLLHPQIEDSPRERFYGFFYPRFFSTFLPWNAESLKKTSGPYPNPLPIFSRRSFLLNCSLN